MINLRPYQQECKDDIYKEWDKGHDNVLLVMPTGGGKTKTFCSIAIDLAIDAAQKTPTAIMVHRKELVQQISLTLADEKVQHNIIAPRPTILEIIGAHRRVYNKQYYDHMAPISVISVDTLNARILKHEKWAKSIKLWITDEAAHLLKENKWGRAVRYFPNAKGLGVTATPERLDKKGLGAHADGVFHKMVLGPPSRWMIDQGFLSKYKIAVPKSDYQDYLEKTKGDGDYSKKNMASASTKSQITGDVVENYIKFASGKQAIVFTTDINTAIVLEGKFNDRGVAAVQLTSQNSNSERLEGMLAFQDKSVKVLVNVDLFDEGLDVPGIECVIMARPTMSLSKYLQMIGRGLRVAEDKEFLILIDHVGNVMKHGLPSKIRQWTLDRIKKRNKPPSLIKICHACNSPYERFLTKCPWCGAPANAGNGGGRILPEQVDGDLELIDPDLLEQMDNSAVLEPPDKVGERVAHVAGRPAGIKAMRNQEERIETQGNLVETIAKWAGEQRDSGMNDREIHKLFWLEQGKTISQALAQPKAEMIKTIQTLDVEE